MTNKKHPEEPERVGDILFRKEDGGQPGPDGELVPNQEWAARIEAELEDGANEPAKRSAQPISDDPERIRTVTPPYPFDSPRNMSVAAEQTVITPAPGLGARLWRFLTTPIPPRFGGRIIDAAMQTIYRELCGEPIEPASDPAWLAGMKQRYGAWRQRRDHNRKARNEPSLERLVGVASQWSFETRNYYADPATRVFAAADGDGFARDVAAAYALEAAQRIAGYVRTQTEQNPGVFYDEQKRAELQERIEIEIEDANRRIYEKAGILEQPELQGMSSSLTLAVIAGGQLFTANVGKGRAYQLLAAGRKGEQHWTLVPEQASDDTEHRLGRTNELRVACLVQPHRGDVLLTSPAAHYFKLKDVQTAIGRAFWTVSGRMRPRMTVSYEINPQDIAEGVSAALTQPLMDVDSKRVTSDIGYHAFDEIILRPALRNAVRSSVPELRNESDERVEEYIRRERIYLTSSEPVPLMDEFSERYGGIDHAVVYVRGQSATGAKIGNRISWLRRNDKIPVQYAGETFSPRPHAVERIDVVRAETAASIRYLEHMLIETRAALEQKKGDLNRTVAGFTAVEAELKADVGRLQKTVGMYTLNPDGAVAQQRCIEELEQALVAARNEYSQASRAAETRHKRDLEKAVGVANGTMKMTEKERDNLQEALGIILHYFEPNNGTTLDQLEHHAAERFGLKSPMYEGLKSVIAGIRGHLQSVYTQLEMLASLQSATREQLGRTRKELAQYREDAAREQVEVDGFVNRVIDCLVQRTDPEAILENARLYRTAQRNSFAEALEAAAIFLGAYFERIDAAQTAEVARLATKREYDDLEQRARGEKDAVVREREEARSRAKELDGRLQAYIETYGAVIGALNNVARYLATPPQEGVTADFPSEILREKAKALEGEDKDANLYKLLTAMADVMEGVERAAGEKMELADRIDVKKISADDIKRARDNKEYAKARALTEALLAVNPQNKDALYYAGTVHMALGEYDQARGYLTRLPKGHTSAQAQLAKIEQLVRTQTKPTGE